MSGTALAVSAEAWASDGTFMLPVASFARYGAAAGVLADGLVLLRGRSYDVDAFAVAVANPGPRFHGELDPLRIRDALAIGGPPSVGLWRGQLPSSWNLGMLGERRGLNVIRKSPCCPYTRMEDCMTYRYEFDDTPYETVVFRRENYEPLHEAYEIILSDLKEWNRMALEAGARQAPYRDEVRLFQNLRTWGQKELDDASKTSIVVSNMSIGSLRYSKAALEYASLKAGREAVEKSKGVPSAVAVAIGEKARRFAEHARKIEVAPAGIIDELRSQVERD